MLARPTYFSECVNRTNSDFGFVMAMDETVIGSILFYLPDKGKALVEGFSIVIYCLGFSSRLHYLLLK